MTDNKALIARLRDGPVETSETETDDGVIELVDLEAVRDDMNAAADALEAAEARVKELKGLAKEYLKWDGGQGSKSYHAGKAYSAREALRAALSTAQKEM
jgi:hypothetical protein